MSPFFVGYVNLIKTILGTGIISYPYLISINGICISLLLTFLSCFFSTVGLLIYARANHKKYKTLSTLTDNKHVQIAVNSIIVFKCSSVAISYIIIISRIIESFCQSFNFSHKKTAIISLVLLTAPISTIQRFSKLRFTSFLGISASFIMVIASFYRYFTMKPEGNVEFTKKLDFSSIGSYVFAFTCHQTIFSYQNEREIPLQTVNTVVITSMVSALVIYLVFGFLNAKLFTIKSNFFDSLPSDSITYCMQFCFLFTVIFSIPLQLNAAQYYLKVEKLTNRYLFVLLIYIIGLFFALNEISLNTVLSCVGGTASCLICFVISGGYFLFYGERKYQLLQIGAFGTLVFGGMVLIITLITSGKTAFENIKGLFQ